jgi:hypothetical protein
MVVLCHIHMVQRDVAVEVGAILMNEQIGMKSQMQTEGFGAEDREASRKASLCERG